MRCRILIHGITVSAVVALLACDSDALKDDQETVGRDLDVPVESLPDVPVESPPDVPVESLPDVPHDEPDAEDAPVDEGGLFTPSGGTSIVRVTISLPGWESGVEELEGSAEPGRVPDASYHFAWIDFDDAGVSPSIVEDCPSDSDACSVECPDDWYFAAHASERVFDNYMVKQFSAAATWFNPPCEPWTMESVVTDWKAQRVAARQGPDVFVVGGLAETRDHIAAVAVPGGYVCGDCGGMPFDVYLASGAGDGCGHVEFVQVAGTERVLHIDFEVFPSCGTAD